MCWKNKGRTGHDPYGGKRESVVACGEGVLLLTEVQLEGKKRMGGGSVLEISCWG